jgi:hypothetical protein
MSWIAENPPEVGELFFGGSSGGVVTPLSFVSQPQSKTVDEYALATFSCEVTGGVAPYSYQYKKNGANVGTNSMALSFTAASTDKNASITVVVTDSAGTSITSTAAVLGVTSYRYKLDGVTQYIKLTPVASPEPSGVTLEFDAIANADAVGVLVGGNQSGLLTWRMAWAGGILDLYRTATVHIDGVIKTNGQAFALDGLSHHIKITLSSGAYRAGITCVGAVYNADTGDVGNFSNSIIYNINPYNAARNGFIPLNNKSQGANQLATSGTINATIVNYNAAGWVAI